MRTQTKSIRNIDQENSSIGLKETMEDQTERMYEVMRKESNRLKTFQMYPPWPKDYVDIKKLAKAGFFYAFNRDNVHCAFCRGQVCRWDRDDDPMAEHARHFSTCPFIMGGEVGNEPIGEDPFPGPKRPRPYDVCGINQNFPISDPHYEPEQQNYQDQDNNDQQQAEPILNRRPSPDAQPRSLAPVEPQNYIQQQPQPQLSQPMQRPVPSLAPLVPPIEIPSHLAEPNRRRNTPNVYPANQYLRLTDYPVNQQRPNNETIVSNQNYSSEQSNNNNLNGICKICYTNSIELVFLPCGHSVSCLSCAERLHDCPFCRETITTRIRTYLV